MGKADHKRLPVVRQQRAGASRTFLCRNCSAGLCRLFTVKCVVLLLLGTAAFLSAVFLMVPLRYRQAGYDATDSVKHSATVQAYFQLQKPVPELIPYIARLEYDVNEEIGVPSSKVVVLSLHPSSTSYWTNVIFGFIPDPMNSITNTMFFTVLKPSLIELFLQDVNLTLTSNIFGKPTSFQILNFPGGISIRPEQIPSFVPALFTFTLNSSINDIQQNLPMLKEQMRSGLRLLPNEVVYFQFTNNQGSTKDSPVKIEASIATDLGTLLPDRLRRLAQAISSSRLNLGLDHAVFGKVKEISLSGFPNLFDPPTPVPSPSPSPSPSLVPTRDPSPEQIHNTLPPYSPAFSPNFQHSQPPSSSCCPSAPSGASQRSSPTRNDMANHSVSPMANFLAPSVAQKYPHCDSTDPQSPLLSHPDQISPIFSLAATPHNSPALYGSRGSDESTRKGLGSRPQVSSFATSQSYPSAGTWWFYLIQLMTFLHLLCIS